MNLARPTIVVEVLGYVDILLHFDERHADAKGMQAASRNVVKVTLGLGLPIDYLLERAVKSSVATRSRSKSSDLWVLKADAKISAGLSIE